MKLDLKELIKNYLDVLTVKTIDLSSLTTASNVSIGSSNATKYGKVVCLNLVIDVTASKSEGATLLSNVPNEILPANQTNGVHNGMPVRLETAGTIVLSEATSAKTRNRITFTYITNN